MSARVEGQCDDRFSGLRQTFEKELANGDELGASVAVTVDGRFAVDLWGGWRDAARTLPWQPDTLVNVFSTTKTVLALAALVLVDQGKLELDAPVARYWPEFAANGKQDVRIRHLLSHTSGVSGWDSPVSAEELYDVPLSTARLAAQAPWWPPGTASGYHSATQGHLVGEVIRRITGATIGRFVADHVTGPLGADFHIGLGPAELTRVTDIVSPPPHDIDLSSFDPDDIMIKTFMSARVDTAQEVNTTAWRTAELAAGNGHGTAHSLALLHAVVTGGGVVGGVRLLSPETIEKIFWEQSDGIDLVLKVPLRWGIGYALAPTPAVPCLPNRRICFWAGHGGSFVLADLDKRATFAYVMNKMAPGSAIGSERSRKYITELMKAL